MEWTHEGNTVTDEYFKGLTGFVYIIENLTNGRKYVGQKKAWSHKYSVKTNPKTKVKKRTKVIIPSDWKTYYGSSEELKKDVLELGADNFKREILHLCKTKGLMNYEEMREQIIRDVLRDLTYYNSFVGGRIHRKHVVDK